MIIYYGNNGTEFAMHYDDATPIYDMIEKDFPQLATAEEGPGLDQNDSNRFAQLLQQKLSNNLFYPPISPSQKNVIVRLIAFLKSCGGFNVG